MSGQRHPTPAVLLALSLLASLAAEAAAQCPDQTFASNYPCATKAEGDVLVVGCGIGMLEGAGTTEGDGLPEYVHVYRRSGGVWAHEQGLDAWSTTYYSCGVWEQFDWFGSTLDLSPAQERIAVGAPWRDQERGAVYTYVDAGGSWVGEQLVTWDGAFAGTCSTEGSEFGRAVALDGDTLVAAAWDGASATLVFFRLHGGVWSLEDEVDVPGVAPQDYYGTDTLDLDGDRAVLGDLENNTVSVIERTGASWSVTATVQGAGLPSESSFTSLVRLDGDHFLVSAPGYDMLDGQAFVFALTGGVWTVEGTFASFTDVPGATDLYGLWGDLEGDLAAVSHRDGIDRYRRLPGGWQLLDRLTPTGMPELAGAGQTLGVRYPEVSVYTDGAATCALSTDTVAISLSAGGTQSMTLVQPSSLAGAGYLVLGSLAGTQPGVSAFGLTLPLQPDVYFLWTVNHPGSAPLSATLGTLDGVGQASAAFTLPMGSASSLTGLVLHHAYVTFDLATGLPQSTSNAAPLVLVP